MVKPVRRLAFIFIYIFLLSDFAVAYKNGTDYSHLFNDLHSLNNLQFKNLRDWDLKNLRFILIPGMFSSVFRKLGGFPVDYFDDYINFFEENCVDYELLSVNSQDGPDANEDLVKQTILSSDKPVIVISHSYGGLYGLNALVKNETLWGSIHGFIAIQSPFSGTKIADIVYHNNFLKYLATYVLNFFGGSENGLIEITKKRSMERMYNWHERLAKLSKNTPVIFVTSKIKKNMFHNLLWGVDEDTDGLIESESALIYGDNLHRATINNWHHLDTVGFSYDRWLFGTKQKNRRFFLNSMLSAISMINNNK